MSKPNANIERILETWTNVHGGCVFNIHAEKSNPLKSLLSGMRVSYKTGGVFNIRRVRFDKDSSMYMDYLLLVEGIDDRE